MLDNNGRMILDVEWDELTEVNSKTIGICKNGKWGCFDIEKNQVIIPLEYGYISPFSGDYAVACSDNISNNYFSKRVFYFINRDNEVVYEGEFGDAFVYEDGMANVGDYVEAAGYNQEQRISAFKNRKHHWININTKKVYPYESGLMSNYNEGILSAYENGKYGCMNLAGELIIPCEYDARIIFENDRAVGKKNGQYFIINKRNEIVSKLEFDYVSDIHNGRTYGFIGQVKEGEIPKTGQYCILDSNGQRLGPLRELDSVEEPENGVWWVEKGGLYTIIDMAGNYVTNSVWKDIMWPTTSNGLKAVSDGKAYGIVDGRGNVIIDYVWDSIIYDKDDLFAVKQLKNNHDVLNADWGMSKNALIQNEGNDYIYKANEKYELLIYTKNLYGFDWSVYYYFVDDALCYVTIGKINKDGITTLNDLEKLDKLFEEKYGKATTMIGTATADQIDLLLKKAFSKENELFPLFSRGYLGLNANIVLDTYLDKGAVITIVTYREYYSDLIFDPLTASDLSLVETNETQNNKTEGKSVVNSSHNNPIYILKDAVLPSVQGYPDLDPVFASIDILSNCVYFGILDSLKAGIITEQEDRYPKYGEETSFVAKIDDTSLQVCFPVSYQECVTVTVSNSLNNERIERWNFSAFDMYRKVYFPKKLMVQLISPDDIVNVIVPIKTEIAANGGDLSIAMPTWTPMPVPSSTPTPDSIKQTSNASLAPAQNNVPQSSFYINEEYRSIDNSKTSPMEFQSVINKKVSIIPLNCELVTAVDDSKLFLYKEEKSDRLDKSIEKIIVSSLVSSKYVKINDLTVCDDWTILLQKYFQADAPIHFCNAESWFEFLIVSVKDLPSLLYFYNRETHELYLLIYYDTEFSFYDANYNPVIKSATPKKPLEFWMPLETLGRKYGEDNLLSTINDTPLEVLLSQIKNADKPQELLIASSTGLSDNGSHNDAETQKQNDLDSITVGHTVKGSVNVRMTPDLNSQRIDQLGRNTEVIVLEKEKGKDNAEWYLVQFNGEKKGYIRADLLVVDDHSPTHKSEQLNGNEDKHNSESMIYRDLKKGDVGDDVLRARKKLYELGYFKKEQTQDVFTDTMLDAVKEFEKDWGVKQDGILSIYNQELLYKKKGVLKTPTNVRASYDGRFVKITWDPVEHANRYTVYVSADGKSFFSISNKDNSIDTTPTTQKSTYDIVSLRNVILEDSVMYYKVQAVDTTEEYKASEETKIYSITIEATEPQIPLEIKGFNVHYNIIGIPEISIKVKNTSKKITVKAFTFDVICYDAYGRQRQAYNIGDTVQSFIWQEGYIKPGKTWQKDSFRWTLHGMDGVYKIDLYLTSILTDDGKTIDISYANRDVWTYTAY